LFDCPPLADKAGPVLRAGLTDSSAGLPIK
jgi:hypothetical protein